MAEDDYTPLMLAPDQRGIIDELSTVIGEKSGLSSPVLRGFFWRSMRSWQRQHRKPTSAVREMAPAERIRAAREIFESLKELVTATLASNRDRRRFDQAYEAGFALWLTKYSGVESGKAAEGGE